MPYLLNCSDELHALHDLLDLVLREGKPKDNYLELLSCIVSIPFEPSEWEKFQLFRTEYFHIGGETTRKGWEKASRVYTNRKDRPTKPSYIGRLENYPDKPRRSTARANSINQLEKIVAELARKPGLSNLSFVVHRPADLFDQFRPGYVPCVTAGDFKFRQGKLNLSVLLRTSDVFAVAYADIFYLRELQMRVLAEASKLTRSEVLKKGRVGNLTLFLSRAFVNKTRKAASSKRAGGNKTDHLVPRAKALLVSLRAFA